MGKLFWRFFIYGWLAQLTVLACGSLAFQSYFIASCRPGKIELLKSIPPMLTAVLSSLVLAIVLAWYLAKPIRSLRRAITAAEGGDLDVHLDPVIKTRRDELADLGRHFERMTARLRGVLEGQRRLLHDVSHEMRSPLARLQAAVDLARQQPDKLDDHLKRIDLEAVRIDSLVEELLTLARLQSGIDAELEQQVHLVDVVNAVIEDCHFEARRDNGRIKLLAASNPQVEGNPELLHRAVENLVRNAVKHAGEGASIAVTLRQSPDGTRALLRVLDNGCGVPDEYLDRIFEPFERPVRTEASGTSGHGLGLTIARRIIAAHGGSIRASNRPKGGLVIEVVLPTTVQPNDGNLPVGASVQSKAV